MRAMELRHSTHADTLASRLRQAREHARLTIDEAAAKVPGLSAKRLQAAEFGAGRAPDITIVRALAALYAVEPLWLAAGALAGARFVPAWVTP